MKKENKLQNIIFKTEYENHPEQLNDAIRNRLEELSEEKYRDFSASLIPGETQIIGVRLPVLRTLAKILASGSWQFYLEHARDTSMEEIMLQGMTLGSARASFQIKRPWLERIIPKIRSWSICDSICASLKISETEKADVWEFLQPYLNSSREYDIRFGIVMILNYFIEQNYLDHIFQIFDSIRHDGYYAKMAVAWAISVCWRRFPEETIRYLNFCTLDSWTYNKSLQKIIESRYSSPEQKDLMRRMKRK